MACEAAEIAGDVVDVIDDAIDASIAFCRNNPATCVALVIAGVVIVVQPELVPLLAL